MIPHRDKPSPSIAVSHPVKAIAANIAASRMPGTNHATPGLDQQGGAAHRSPLSIVTARIPLARPPFRSEPLAFGYLGRCHEVLDLVPGLNGTSFSLCGCEIEPHVCLDEVLRNPLA